MLANKSNLCFSYENLERATDYFSDKNKLGQGGSGSVYKVSSVLIIHFLEFHVGMFLLLNWLTLCPFCGVGSSY
jgi:hypothetical protein